MVELRDAERDTQLGTITEQQLKFLIDALEEESMSDNDYYISADTIDMLETEGAECRPDRPPAAGARGPRRHRHSLVARLTPLPAIRPRWAHGDAPWSLVP